MNNSAVEFLSIESPIKWIRDLEPKIQISAKSTNQSLKEFSLAILRESEGREKDMTLDEGSDWHQNVTFMACALTRVAAYIITEDFDSASSLLQRLEDNNLKSMINISDSQLEVVSYCRDALLFVLNSIKDHWNDLEKRERAKAMRSRWGKLLNRKCQAMVEFLKGSLAVEYFVDERQTLKIFKTAIELDPDDPSSSGVYYELASRRSKWIRKQINRKVDGQMNRLLDNSEEFRWAEKAYNWSPNDPHVIITYALAIKATLWAQKADYLNQNEGENCLKVADLLKQALLLAEADGNAKLVETVKVDLADYLTIGTYENLDRDLGHRLFQEIEDNVNDETSALVLRKLAKYYYYRWQTANPKGKLATPTNNQDLHLALPFFERTLQSGPVHFRNVARYLKALRALGQNEDKMLSVVDSALAGILRDGVAAKLHVVRGCLLWAYWPDGKDEAIKEWLLVMKNLPRHIKDVYEAIKQPVKRMLPLDCPPCWIDCVTKYVEERRRQGYWSSREEVSIVDYFIQKLKNEKPSRRESAADKDMNWRSK